MNNLAVHLHPNPYTTARESQIGNKRLPSTYIKYWWYWRRLNTQDLLDTLLLIFIMIETTRKILKTWQELKNSHIE